MKIGDLVKIKKNSNLEEFIYSGMTGTISYAGEFTCKVSLDNKSRSRLAIIGNSWRRDPYIHTELLEKIGNVLPTE